MFKVVRYLTVGSLLSWSGIAGAQNCPPPPARPLFEFQVERPATFIPDSSVTPYPAPQQPGMPLRDGTVVSFVVDTLGRPDTVTYKIIREVEPGLGQDGRNVLARWRYQPAQVRGCVVSQLIQTLIARR